jgi:hypothetical protein
LPGRAGRRNDVIREVGRVKLSDRHGPIPGEKPAGPATAVVNAPARTMKNNDGPAAGNRAVARLLT